MSFQDCLSRTTTRESRDSAAAVHDTVAMAKQILLSNKVQNFTAAEVVALTRLLLEREDMAMQQGLGNGAA